MLDVRLLLVGERRRSEVLLPVEEMTLADLIRGDITRSAIGEERGSLSESLSTGDLIRSLERFACSKDVDPSLSEFGETTRSRGGGPSIVRGDFVRRTGEVIPCSGEANSLAGGDTILVGGVG